MKRIYLDYAATTPVDRRVLRAMEPYFTTQFGNPGSLHSFGQEAIAAIDRSRETVARSIGAEFREIIFTGSATEANNVALRSIDHPGSRIIISAIEHESILETARELERAGVEVIIIPVDRQGIVDVSEIKKSLNEKTALVSIMFSNNEIGTVQPITEIAKIIGEFRAQLPAKSQRYPLFHTDAVQAFQFLNCNVQQLGVDLMTFSAHKIYGPKGVGALYIRNFEANKRNIQPIIAGGGQEFGMRSGTENVPGIAGFAKAVELNDIAREKEAKRIAVLRQKFWRGIQKIAAKKIKLNGNPSMPNILNIYFSEFDAQDLLTRFDLAGLAVSSGSACRSRAMESSYVIEALGYTRERAKSSIRFSLGKPTTSGDIDKALKIIYNTICRKF